MSRLIQKFKDHLIYGMLPMFVVYTTYMIIFLLGLLLGILLT